MAKGGKPGKPGRPKQPDSKRSLGVDRHTLPRVVFHMPQDLRDLLGELAATNRRTLTAELLIAIESHLRAAGKIPEP